MLVRILRSSVVEVWKVIAPMIKMTFPDWVDGKENNLVNTLEALLDGSLVAWFAYVGEEDKQQLVGLVTTHFTYDSVGGTKSLSIYTLYGFNNTPKSVWLDGMETLVKYAKASGCKNITGLTTVDNVKSIAQKLGANIDTTLIVWEI